MTSEGQKQLVEQVWAQEGVHLIVRALADRRADIAHQLCKKQFSDLSEVARLQGRYEEVSEMMRGIEEQDYAYFIPR